MMIRGKITRLQHLRGGVTVQILTDAEQEMILPGMGGEGLVTGQNVEVEVTLLCDEVAEPEPDEGTDAEMADLSYGSDGYGAGE